MSFIRWEWYNTIDYVCGTNDVAAARDMTPGASVDRLNYCLAFACMQGKWEIAKVFIEAGAQDFDWGLGSACCSGYMGIAREMIQLGASDWNRGLRLACDYGHVEVAELMLRHPVTNIGVCIDIACKKQNVAMIRLLTTGHVEAMLPVELDRDFIVQMLWSGIPRRAFSRTMSAREILREIDCAKREIPRIGARLPRVLQDVVLSYFP